MRAKQRYLKTLINWADAGHILGRVIFCHRLIFVILVGSGSSIKVCFHKLRDVLMLRCIPVDLVGKKSIFYCKSSHRFKVSGYVVEVVPLDTYPCGNKLVLKDNIFTKIVAISSWETIAIESTFHTKVFLTELHVKICFHLKFILFINHVDFQTEIYVKTWRFNF